MDFVLGYSSLYLCYFCAYFFEVKSSRLWVHSAFGPCSGLIGLHDILTNAIKQGKREEFDGSSIIIRHGAVIQDAPNIACLVFLYTQSSNSILYFDT